MTQTIEVNLVDVLNRLERKIDHIQDDLTEVKIDVEKLKTQNEQIVKRIDTIETNLSKRLDNVENRLNTMNLGFLGLVGVLVTGLLTVIGKITFFPNP